MTYTLARIDTFELPDRLPADDVGTGQVKTPFVDVDFGGAFDLRRNDDSVFGSRTLQKRCLFYFSDQDERETFFRDLRGYVGVPAKLFRTWDDGTDEWVSCRLANIRGTRTLNNVLHQEVTLIFQIYSPYWRGSYNGAWTFDSGKKFDYGLEFDSGDDYTFNVTSGVSFDVVHDGNTIAKDPIITITSGSAAITSGSPALTISASNIELEYDATINANESLVLNCGNFSVENNGVDDYANFSRGSNHKINEWFRLPAGTTEVTLTFTGGGGGVTCEFAFYDGHQ